MAAYRRVYDSRHLQADCQEPGSAPTVQITARRMLRSTITRGDIETSGQIELVFGTDAFALSYNALLGNSGISKIMILSTAALSEILDLETFIRAQSVVN